MAEIKVKKTKFIDLDLNFTKHPTTFDVSRKVDENAVITSIKNLVRTKPFERPFHPEISCQVGDLLFENFTPSTASTIKTTILYVIQNFEPRVEVVAIDVNSVPDSNSLSVVLLFKIIGSLQTIKTQFFLERTI